jgi:peptidyl-prolyl cis-trans isomerase A (cyclophilin A)
MTRKFLVAGTAALALAACEKSTPQKEAPPAEAAPKAEAPATPRAPDVFSVRFETSKGPFTVEVHRDWAPNGVDRLYQLVGLHYYDDNRFFRVLPGFMAQFGMSGDPAMNAQWGDNNIPDDPVKQSNTRRMVTFAKCPMPNCRSTQLFINYGDNSQLDAGGFAPIGRVTEGMAVVDKLYSGYGEMQPRGPGTDPGRITTEGNSYLEHDFPKLDYIKTARIVGGTAATTDSVKP